MTNYLKYKSLKSKLCEDYRGYPLDRVLGSYLAGWVWSSGYKSRIVMIISLIRNKPFVEMKYSGDTLITYSIDRAGYNELMYDFIQREGLFGCKPFFIGRVRSSPLDVIKFLMKLI